MNLLELILESMQDDDEDSDKQSEFLEDLYTSASDSEKNLLDNALICICGYRLKTLIDKKNE